jgi:hypothetical protein
MNKYNGDATPVQCLNGRILARWLRGQPPHSRAEIAATLVRGEYRVADLLQVQAARLCDVDPQYVNTALGRNGSRGPHKRTIDRVIKKYGVDALMRGLDRATAPMPAIAAE